MLSLEAKLILHRISEGHYYSRNGYIRYMKDNIYNVGDNTANSICPIRLLANMWSVDTYWGAQHLPRGLTNVPIYW